MTDTFQFGVNHPGLRCCGKPVGCTITHDGCAHLRHPWKRAHVFGDVTVRCQARSLDDSGTVVQCGLFHGHDGSCITEAPGESRAPGRVSTHRGGSS